MDDTEASAEPTIKPVKPSVSVSSEIKQAAAIRRDAIAVFIRRAGIDNFSRSVCAKLAKEHNVSERTIWKDINWVKGHYKLTTTRELTIQMDLAGKAALNKALALLNDPDKDIQIKASRAVAVIMEKYTKIAEAYGLKEKVPEKAELNVTGAVKQYKIEFVTVKHERAIDQT